MRSPERRSEMCLNIEWPELYTFGTRFDGTFFVVLSLVAKCECVPITIPPCINGVWCDATLQLNATCESGCESLISISLFRLFMRAACNGFNGHVSIFQSITHVNAVCAAACVRHQRDQIQWGIFTFYIYFQCLLFAFNAQPPMIEWNTNGIFWHRQNNNIIKCKRRRMVCSCRAWLRPMEFIRIFTARNQIQIENILDTAVGRGRAKMRQLPEITLSNCHILLFLHESVSPKCVQFNSYLFKNNKIPNLQRAPLHGCMADE